MDSQLYSYHHTITHFEMSTNTTGTLNCSSLQSPSKPLWANATQKHQQGIGNRPLRSQHLHAPFIRLYPLRTIVS